MKVSPNQMKITNEEELENFHNDDAWLSVKRPMILSTELPNFYNNLITEDVERSV